MIEEKERAQAKAKGKEKVDSPHHHPRAHPATRKEKAKARELGKGQDPAHQADHDLPPLLEHHRPHPNPYAFAADRLDILLEIALNNPERDPTQGPALEKV